MNIRSFTVGAALTLDELGRATLINRLGHFAAAGRATLEAAGFTLQSTRLSTQPVDLWLSLNQDMARTAAAVSSLSAQCKGARIDYCSLGTLQASDDWGSARELAEAIPSILKANDNLFASLQVGSVTSAGAVINLEAVKVAVRIILYLAHNTPDGFGNLRFAAAANCPPHVPFFPASYYAESNSNNGNPEFGLALEAADLAVRAFTDARTLDEARENLLGLLVEEAGRAGEVCAVIEAQHGYSFTGMDISMAPYPSQERSIAHALELVMGGDPLGGPGTLAAATFITGVLKDLRSRLPTIGYSGLMLPVLEDQTLADRAGEGLVTLDTLLLMSSVCGLGLDTIPLPGDISENVLASIILDTASLALRLDKPLTARLLPVPGKIAGEQAEWPDFPYFARGRVMNVPVGGSAQSLLLKGRSLRVV
ncbi:MAG: DUF711 family protein [Chloroflexota bacterium]|nr:DUF711 family protein [Chloroflexota bacterium]